MAKTSERTSFTKDVQGRYLCNDISEVNAWQAAGGRPFDVIVIGGGTFGAAIAEHIWFRQKQTGGGLRTLVLEAGLFTVPEHVQNTGIQGLADPATPFFLTVPLLMKAARTAFSDANGNDANKEFMILPDTHVLLLRTAPTATGTWRVTGADTSQGFIPLAAAGVAVIALGTIESARVARLSFDGTGIPTLPLMGKNLMAHLRFNLVIRVPRSAIPGLSATTNELQSSSLFVKCRATKPNGDLLGHFHLQITATGGGNTVGSEDELFRKIPDVDFYDQLRTSTDTRVAIAIRGIGEITPADLGNLAAHPSSVDLDARTDEYGVRRALVTIALTQRDNDLWNFMDATMQQIANLFANGQPMEVIQSNRDGLGTTHHETGTLWMGTDPTKSVTDADGRFHHTENLYAVGPCLFPSIGSPNPMLTGIAMARRTGDRIMTPPAFVADAGFEALFDGTTLGNWKMSTIRNQPGRDNPGNFVVRRGALEAHPGTDLGLLWLTRPTPPRYVLRLQWMMTAPDDNSASSWCFRIRSSRAMTTRLTSASILASRFKLMSWRGRTTRRFIAPAQFIRSRDRRTAFGGPSGWRVE